MSKTADDDHPFVFVKRDENWNYAVPNPDHADEVSQVLSFTLASTVATGLINQNPSEFVPKPTPSRNC